jgi:hypothetical protein
LRIVPAFAPSCHASHASLRVVGLGARSPPRESAEIASARQVFASDLVAKVLRIFLTASVGLVASVLISGALAVHVSPDSSFQLDGNATTETETPQRDDWDRVFAGTDSADPSSFVVDPAGETIFTGGGSKDDLDIPNWQHKSGSVPPKDEITNAYAALYDVSGELRLYFGADRFANNGSSQIGFWFFQNDVARKRTVRSATSMSRERSPTTPPTRATS